MTTLHFKSKESFRKFNAYRYIHGVNKGGRDKIEIAGKVHKVNHMPPISRNKRGQVAFMNIFMGLIFAFMVVALLTALLPAFKEQIISATSYATGMNCVGSADYNATAAAFTGGTSATTCLALGLFIPFLVLAILMGIVSKILYDRGAQPPGYG